MKKNIFANIDTSLNAAVEKAIDDFVGHLARLDLDMQMTISASVLIVLAQRANIPKETIVHGIEDTWDTINASRKRDASVEDILRFIKEEKK